MKVSIGKLALNTHYISQVTLPEDSDDSHFSLLFHFQ
jgi:hypothetical protein